MFNTSRFHQGRLMLLIALLAFMIMIPVAAAQDDGQTVELVGMIEAMSLNTITVNQQEVNIAQAEVNVPLVLTAVVKVEGALNDDGSITARQVNPAPAGVQPGEAELIGALESINGSLWVVNGQTIDITVAQVTGAPAVGQRVRVHAMAMGANLWRAREAEVVQVDPTTPVQTPVVGEFEIVGTLQSISGRTLVVSGQLIDFGGAEIKDPLVVGTLVKVHVSQVNGVLVAREIELADSDDDDDDNGNGNGNGNANTSGDNGNSNSNDDDSNSNSSDDDNSNSSANVAFSAEQAIAEVLRVYPNAQIRSIELTTAFGGTVVWEITIAGRIELIIDAQTGAILVIDRQGGSGNANGNTNGNSNSDDDDDNGNGNGNSNSNDDGGNSNSNDDGGNSNSNDDGGNSNDDGNDNDDDDD